MRVISNSKVELKVSNVNFESVDSNKQFYLRSLEVNIPHLSINQVIKTFNFLSIKPKVSFGWWNFQWKQNSWQAIETICHRVRVFPVPAGASAPIPRCEPVFEQKAAFIHESRGGPRNVGRMRKNINRVGRPVPVGREKKTHGTQWCGVMPVVKHID